MASQGHAAVAQRLHGAALSYQMLGYSVIPVHGDAQPESAKIATINWKPFQQKQALPEQIEHWFLRRGYQGLAIVTGAVSCLAVLDFDDPQLAERFQRQCPDLTQTRTVLSATRQLPHYYFEIPPGIPLESIRLPGVDLQYDGRYVLTAPTVINGKAYSISRGGKAKKLTIAEIRALRAFLDEIRLTTQEASEKPQISSSAAVAVSPKKSDPIPPVFTSQDAIALYRQQANLRGRNNALFFVACLLRDALWTQEAVNTTLAAIHSAQPTNNQHAPETPQQRQAEALATIASAFKRQPRKPRAAQPHQSLPNSLREHLLQSGQIALARVLDGLLIAGVQEGQIISEKFMRITLEGQIGRHSIRKALAAIDPEGQPIFAKNPSPRPPTPTAVAAATAERPNNSCELFRVTEPDKKRGRPTTSYIMPNLDALCARFGVKRTSSDDIQRDDLWSTRKYRQALHREFIKRRPGQYSGEWLAGRLGISKRSIQRYRQDVPLNQRPNYHSTWVTWETLQNLPHEANLNGVFLQDATGKRYPATQAMAQKLLAKGLAVIYQRQTTNTYWHQDAVLDAQDVFVDIPETPEMRQNPRFAPLHVPSLAEPELAAKIAVESDPPPPDPRRGATALPPAARRVPSPVPEYHKKPKRYYRQPLPDAQQEQAALRLYEKVGEKSRGDKTRLSKSRSRYLVERYGMHNTTRLLQVLSWRDNIANPAGFSVIYLRSESQMANNTTM